MRKKDSLCSHICVISYNKWFRIRSSINLASLPKTTEFIRGMIRRQELLLFMMQNQKCVQWCMQDGDHQEQLTL